MGKPSLDVIHEAERAKWFGPEFVAKSRTVASLFAVPVEWLLAAMSWETNGYDTYWGPDKLDPRSGLHWSVNPNPKDAGGGLFGFPQLASRPYANWTPLQQLDTVQHYIQGWMKKVRIESFPSPADFYVLVRGPYGLAPENYDNDEFDMVGLTLGKVRKIYWDHVYNSYGWTPDKFPGRGPDIGLVGETWNVRIGAWTGKFGFDSAGSVWYASYPAAQSYFGRDGRLTASAEPEIDRSARNYGHWHSEGDKVRWRFQPVSDIRRFEVTLPVNPHDGQRLPGWPRDV